MTRVEFEKQLKRARTRLILLLMAAFPILLTLVFRLGNTQPTHGSRASFIELSSDSGLNMAITVLFHVGPIVLPIVTVIVAGSAIAEEAAWRTLGYLLIRPVARGRLLTGKLVVAAAVIVAAAIVAAIVAVVAGIVAFGWSPVTLPAGGTVAAATVLAEIAVATLYISWCVTSIAGLSFLVSTVSSAPLNAAAAGFAFYVVSQVLDSFSALGGLRDVLPTHYAGAWLDLIAGTAGWDGMIRGAVLQLPYLALFLGMAWWLFSRRDIVT